MIPLAAVWKYRRIIGYGLAVLAILGVALWYRASLIEDGRQQGRAEVKAKWDAAIAAANRETARKDAAYAALQGERNKAMAQVRELLNRPPPAPRTLIREVPTNAPVSSCPTRSPIWVREYNAIAGAANSRAPEAR